MISMRMFRFDYENILESRKSREARSKLPWNNFLKKYFLVTDLFDSIHKKFKDKDFLQESRKQDVIGLVTALEVYFKDIILYLIRKQKVDVSKLFDDDDQVKILDLENIIKANITIPDLLHLKYNFMKLSDIDTIFRRALNIKIFDELKKFTFRIDNKRGLIPVKFSNRKKDDFFIDADYYKGIDGLIKKRNSFIHDTNPKLKISKADIEAANESIFEFVMFLDTFLDLYSSNKLNNLKEK